MARPGALRYASPNPHHSRRGLTQAPICHAYASLDPSSKVLRHKGTCCALARILAGPGSDPRTNKGLQAPPQLIRFYEQDSPRYAINGFLAHVYAESLRRGYHFDKSKIGPTSASLAPMEATTGQLDYEWRHLLGKLRDRSPDTYTEVRKLKPEASPIFSISAGPVADWERP